MHQLLLAIIHFVICQYLQLPLILLIKKKKSSMGAKHYKYIAKNNTLEIKENFFLGGGSDAV